MATTTSVTLESSFSGTYEDYSPTIRKIDASQVKRGIEIEGNDYNNTIIGSAYNDEIDGDDGNDSINGGAGNDTLDGGEGNDTLTGGNGNDIFIYENGDGNDVITDYTQGRDVVRIEDGYISSATSNGSDVVLTVGSGKITLKNAVGKTIRYYNNGRTIGSTVVGSSSSSTSSGSTSTDLTAVTLDSSFRGTYEDYDSTIRSIDASKVKRGIKIEGNDNNNTIIGSSYNDTIEGDDGNDLINGGSGNDYLEGDDGRDSLIGDAGNDTLDGGDGNDTLTGGAGRDVFIYETSEGNDVITDYTAGQDTIKIEEGIISRSYISGSNVVFNVGSGRITVQNSVGKSISLINSAGDSITTIIGSSSTSTTSGGSSNTTISSGLSYSNNNQTLNVTSPFTGTLNVSNYASTVNTINASTDNKFITINGTNRAEFIRASRGGSTIAAGKGNDTIYGNSGADTFVYKNGDGDDVVYSYMPYVDTIKISSGTISTASISGSDVVLKVGSGSLTVKGAKSKNLNITDSSGETKTYTFTETVNNPTTNFEERWFAEDNNFNTDDLGTILEDKSIAVDYKFNDEDIFKQGSKVIPLTSNNYQKK